jgi:hypothetical protein
MAIDSHYLLRATLNLILLSALLVVRFMRVKQVAERRELAHERTSAG